MSTSVEFTTLFAQFQEDLFRNNLMLYLFFLFFIFNLLIKHPKGYNVQINEDNQMRPF